MKTYKNLYPQVCDFENLYLAWRKARKGKRGREGAAAFERVQDDELLALQKELQEFTYTPGPYHSFYIHDPKKRLISAAPFRDRVVHHALYRVIEPIWESRFIHDTYANRVGKGTHRAIDRAQEYLRRNKYFLQCDLRQFFPSIDHQILRAEFARRIRDKNVLWLCDRILESGVGVLAEEYEMAWFPSDDLLAAARPRGLPIGNLTSQFWANVYLNDFDHFIKRELKCPAYVRYVDDFVLFDDDPKRLKDWRSAIVEKLAGLRLTLHEECARTFASASGLPFLGFRLCPEHRLVKYRKKAQFRRKLQYRLEEYESGRLEFPRLEASIKGWINHVRYADTWGLRRSVLRRAVL
ncbi:MAG: reverse transcriptase domain-containing protein [Anaerolineales bacterium]|nr:reverse transcriptase domain-containing protein [Anaerolineales bacterium]